MPLFDRYIAVDWSANNAPKSGKDSIWIAEASGDGLRETSVNPRTRYAAMQHLEGRLQQAMAAGERVMAGFDFPFGYPVGAAPNISGGDWASLWSTLAAEISDTDGNKSNRFVVASALNARLGVGGPRFWGCPVSASNEHLNRRKVDARFDRIAEFRTVERVAKGAKSTWQLFYNGSVGSQCLLGIAHLEKLRRHPVLGPQIAIWPFETDFDRHLDARIVLAEIYPSLGRHDPSVSPKDRAQVEAQVARYADLDRLGALGAVLSLPGDFAGQRAASLREEGWIVGAGHPGLLA